MCWSSAGSWEGSPPAPHPEVALALQPGMGSSEVHGQHPAPASSPSLTRFLGRRGQPGDGYLELPSPAANSRLPRPSPMDQTVSRDFPFCHLFHGIALTTALESKNIFC